MHLLEMALVPLSRALIPLGLFQHRLGLVEPRIFLGRWGGRPLVGAGGRLEQHQQRHEALHRFRINKKGRPRKADGPICLAQSREAY